MDDSAQTNSIPRNHAQLSPYVGGWARCLWAGRPRLVSLHTSDFHGDLPKSHGMRKAYSEIWKAKFSHAFTYIFYSFFFPFGPTFFYYYSHRIPSCCFTSLVLQRNCHFEHLFLSLADNSSHTSKPVKCHPACSVKM